MNYIWTEIRHHIECTSEELNEMCMTHEFELDGEVLRVNPLSAVVAKNGMLDVQLMQLAKVAA